MKKRNLKRLSLQKNVISNFKNSAVKGGAPTNGKNCNTAPPAESELCETLISCYCSDINGCQLTFIIDTDGNLTC